MLLSVMAAYSQFCVMDWEVWADSTPATITSEQGIDHQLCHANPCDTFSLYGDFTVGVRSDSFTNVIVLHGFVGQVGLTVMDTNCAFSVYDTCYSSISGHEEIAGTFGRNFIVHVRLESHQNTATFYAYKVPVAPMAPYVRPCPVGRPDPFIAYPKKNKCECAPVAYDLLGRQYNDPPSGVLVWDGRICAFVLKN